MSMALAGCGSESPDDTSSGNANKDNNNNNGGGGKPSSGSPSDSGGNKLEILNDEFYEDEMGAGVKGTVKNNTDSEISYVGVQAEFLNEEGTRVGEGLDNTTDLAADQKWQFNAMFMGTDTETIDDYRIEVSDSPFS